MKLPLLAGAVATLAMGAAFANDPMNKTMDPAATFKSLDTDGNGRISETEARQHAELSASYRNAVSDSANGMTMEEFKSWAENRQPGQTPPRN